MSASAKQRKTRERNIRELLRNCSKTALSVAASGAGLDPTGLTKDEIAELLVEHDMGFKSNGQAKVTLPDGTSFQASNVQIIEVTKVNQQFAVTDNWFNKYQKVQVAGVNPKIVFAHARYDGPGGLEPTIVLTVEYDVHDDQPPHTWLPGEVGYIVITKYGRPKNWTPIKPDPRYECDFSVVGIDGELFEVWVYHA